VATVLERREHEVVQGRIPILVNEQYAGMESDQVRELKQPLPDPTPPLI